MRTKIFALALGLELLICASAWADYALPIPYEEYTTSGIWTTDFVPAPELVEAVASSRGINASNVHSFADIALPGTWEVRPLDIYNLSNWGQYAVLTLPMTESHASDDYYIVLCTAGDDVSKDERLECQGFVVDNSEHESVYSEENPVSAADCIFFDENFNRIYTVPESKKFYAAVRLPAEYINTGIITVIRGEYVEEEDPAERIDTELLEFITQDLGIASRDLKYITQENLFAPREATQEMKDYVNSDDHEIIGGINTVSIDKEGWYVFKVTLPDDVWSEVQNKDVSDFKFYGLTDSGTNAGEFRSSFIMGVISTWELYTLTGRKMRNFGVKEFLFAGFLNTSQPFTLFAAKVLLSVLTGGISSLATGCNSFLSAGAVVLFMILLRKH